ncbi:MAG: hypothetical protein P8K27_09015 [Gammaproteobacteria bacterium]|nr:hypothetical protein [Gammaproteobacteria bacterium]
MIDQLKNNLTLRPGWMNLVLFFCFYMTFIYLPWDILVKPISEDQEVWFGVLFYGWLAKVGGVCHWVVYGTLLYGMWHMKQWLVTGMILYLWQVGLSMILWNWIREGQPGWFGLISGLAFILLSYFFYDRKEFFIR